jgi:hypothetical protein
MNARELDPLEYHVYEELAVDYTWKTPALLQRRLNGLSIKDIAKALLSLESIGLVTRIGTGDCAWRLRSGCELKY